MSNEYTVREWMKQDDIYQQCREMRDGAEQVVEIKRGDTVYTAVDGEGRDQYSSHNQDEAQRYCDQMNADTSGFSLATILRDAIVDERGVVSWPKREDKSVMSSLWTELYESVVAEVREADQQVVALTQALDELQHSPADSRDNHWTRRLEHVRRDYAASSARSNAWSLMQARMDNMMQLLDSEDHE